MHPILKRNVVLAFANWQNPDQNRVLVNWVTICLAL